MLVNRNRRRPRERNESTQQRMLRQRGRTQIARTQPIESKKRETQSEQMDLVDMQYFAATVDTAAAVWQRG